MFSLEIHLSALTLEIFEKKKDRVYSSNFFQPLLQFFSQHFPQICLSILAQKSLRISMNSYFSNFFRELLQNLHEKIIAKFLRESLSFLLKKHPLEKTFVDSSRISFEDLLYNFQADFYKHFFKVCSENGIRSFSKIFFKYFSFQIIRYSPTKE